MGYNIKKVIKFLATISFAIFFCIILSQSLISATVANSSVYYIFPKSNAEIIKESDLKYTDTFTQYLAKNELFARYGYKFKDKTLNDYFMNMPWYKPNSAVTGDYSKLNKIEQANFNLIDSYYQRKKSTDIKVTSSQLLTEGSKKYWKQEVSKDLNNDGALENITIKFYVDYLDSYGITFSNYQITVNSKGRTYTTSGEAYNTSLGIRFADFNVNDKTTQMYIIENGPSADYRIHIYTFNGSKIIRNQYVVGLINSYDGGSKIYTNINNLPDKNKTIISYFDFEKGLVPLSKQNLINKELTFGANIPLLKTTDDNSLIPTILLYDKNIDWKSMLGSNYLKTVPSNTKLIITDVITKRINIDQNVYYNIWVKVKTPSGDQGFLRFVDGD